MRITKEGSIGSFKNINVKRPWGYYGLYSDNEPCTSKILYLRHGQCLSMQLHQRRAQFYLLLDDKFMIELSDEPVPLAMVKKGSINQINTWFTDHRKLYEGKEGGMFGFERRVIHRLLYLGKKEYGRCLDLAFGENDEEDIIRLDDQYGR